MIKALDEGKSLILFPEGTRGKPEQIAELKNGIGIILSQRPHISYIPTYMSGMGKALPKGERLFVPFITTLNFGNPRKPKSLVVSEIVAEVEQSLLGLAPRHETIA